MAGLDRKEILIGCGVTSEAFRSHLIEVAR
jgi:hypothetical protein